MKFVCIKIKRAYDDKFVNTDCKREDITLIVRVFDQNIKNRLITIENKSAVDEVSFIETPSKILDSFDETYDSLLTTETYDSLTMSTSLNATSLSRDQQDSREQNKRQNKPIESLLDKDEKVIPYVNFKELENLLESQEDKMKIEDFCAQLISLNVEHNEENSNNILETTKI